MPDSKSKVETLRWRDGRLEMIDQRVLPAEFRYLEFDSAAAVADGIRSMVVRGAPAIGCAAAYGIALEARRWQHQAPAEFSSGLEAGFVALAASRPTAVNLFWALARMRNAWQTFSGSTPAQIAPMLLAEAHAIHAADIEANRRMGRHGAALINDGARVLTHCNAGALATAGHGTALGVIRSAIAAGKKVSVFANETRPFLQGARLTAWELAQDHIPVTLIADNAAGFLMSRGEIDVVVVGADRVAANGDVANKIGTYSVAVLAQRHRIPFYVAAPLSTIDPGIASGADIPIEERDADEIRGYGELRWAPQDIAVRNPVFDVTPAELVTGLITEKGVVPAPDAGKIRKLLDAGRRVRS
jgi:methylthioribose-1-phosphate isomerase